MQEGLKRAKYDAVLDENELNQRPFAADSQVLSYIKPYSSVLDIGCSTGYMGKFLQEKRHCKVWGIETDPVAAREAEKVLNGVQIMDLDDLDNLEKLNGEFNYIIMAAVLEHLRNPEKVLSRVKALLKKDGLIVISLPNVAHYSIRFNLLFGHFDYKKYGILDETHCKLYTIKSSMELLKGAGLSVRHFTISLPFPGSRFATRMPGLPLFLGFLKKYFPGLFAEELIFVCSNESKFPHN